MSRGYSASSVFEDWVSLMLSALLGNDAEYLQVVKRYRNEKEKGAREIDYFCFAFAELLKELEASNKECLGELYMQWGLSNKYSGQFFTPPHVAEMMALITRPQGGSVCDPCCGAGIMLVSACKAMTNHELDRTLFVGQDLDLTCVKMTALNMLFFNLNAYVIWGNTLTNERLKVFKTTRSYLGGTIEEIDPKDIPVTDTEIIRKGIQQSLPLAA